MYHTTGLTKAGITGLCARIEGRQLSPIMVWALARTFLRHGICHRRMTIVDMKIEVAQVPPLRRRPSRAPAPRSCYADNEHYVK